jgi:hypothetical protein
MRTRIDSYGDESKPNSCFDFKNFYYSMRGCVAKYCQLCQEIPNDEMQCQTGVFLWCDTRCKRNHSRWETGIESTSLGNAVGPGSGFPSCSLQALSRH